MSVCSLYWAVLPLLSVCTWFFHCRSMLCALDLVCRDTKTLLTWLLKTRTMRIRKQIWKWFSSPTGLNNSRSIHISWLLLADRICLHFKHFGEVKAEPALQQVLLVLFVDQRAMKTSVFFVLVVASWPGKCKRRLTWLQTVSCRQCPTRVRCNFRCFPVLWLELRMEASTPKGIPQTPKQAAVDTFSDV